MGRYAMLPLGGAAGAIARCQIAAYTTFSTFELETLRAVTEGSWMIGAANVVGSVIAGYAALWIGMLLARAL